MITEATNDTCIRQLVQEGISNPWVRTCLPSLILKLFTRGLWSFRLLGKFMWRGLVTEKDESVSESSFVDV